MHERDRGQNENREEQIQFARERLENDTASEDDILLLAREGYDFENSPFRDRFHQVLQAQRGLPVGERPREPVDRVIDRAEARRGRVLTGLETFTQRYIASLSPRGRSKLTWGVGIGMGVLESAAFVALVPIPGVSGLAKSGVNVAIMSAISYVHSRDYTYRTNKLQSFINDPRTDANERADLERTYEQIIQRHDIGARRIRDLVSGMAVGSLVFGGFSLLESSTGFRTPFSNLGNRIGGTPALPTIDTTRAAEELRGIVNQPGPNLNPDPFRDRISEFLNQPSVVGGHDPIGQRLSEWWNSLIGINPPGISSPSSSGLTEHMRVGMGDVNVAEDESLRAVTAQQPEKPSGETIPAPIPTPEPTLPQTGIVGKEYIPDPPGSEKYFNLPQPTEKVVVLPPEVVIVEAPPKVIIIFAEPPTVPDVVSPDLSFLNADLHVQSGDTFWQLYKDGIRVPDNWVNTATGATKEDVITGIVRRYMEQNNPGLHLDRIYPGQVINVDVTDFSQGQIDIIQKALAACDPADYWNNVRPLFEASLRR